MKKEFQVFLSKVNITPLLDSYPNIDWRKTSDSITCNCYNNHLETFEIRVINNSYISLTGRIENIYELEERYSISKEYTLEKLIYKKLLLIKPNKTFRIIFYINHIGINIEYSEKLKGHPAKKTEYTLLSGSFKMRNYKEVIELALNKWKKFCNIMDILNVFEENGLVVM